jgi:hypothetical protein
VKNGRDPGLRREVRPSIGQRFAAAGEDAILDPRHSREVYIRF